jgi:hypothetical protein
MRYKKDILENLPQFLKPETSQPQLPFYIPGLKQLALKKYDVNIMVDNSKLKGAPVIIELNPTYQNLFGRIEKEAQFGVLSTDFTMIRGGALHRANGGYLIVPVEDLLVNPFSYDALKRCQGKVTRATFRDALENTKGVKNSHGIYNYSPSDHDGLSKKDMVFIRIEGGKFKRMKFPGYE